MGVYAGLCSPMGVYERLCRSMRVYVGLCSINQSSENIVKDTGDDDYP